MQSRWFFQNLFFLGLWCPLTLKAEIEATATLGHVLLYGDAGAGNPDQYKVARGMTALHEKDPFDYAVSMGDNLYIDYEPNIFWKVFENPYKALISAGLPFFQVVGNHDMEDDRLEQELRYSREQNVLAQGVGGWVLPSEDYAFSHHGARWIVLNVSQADGTLNWTQERQDFLVSHVCSKSSDWTFLAIHYPLWSTNTHGDNIALQKKLLPILGECPVDMVFMGHDHHAEVMLPWKWTSFVTIGNGHEFRSTVRRSTRESLFAHRGLGFGRLKFSAELAQLTLYNENANELYDSIVQKRVPAWVDTWKQVNDQIWARVDWPEPTEATLEVQIGFSSERINPLLDPSSFDFYPATIHRRTGYRGRGVVYAVAAPQSFLPLYVTTRARIKDSGGRWIYGDMSVGPGRHGNYDGIQSSMLLKTLPTVLSR